MKVQLCFPLSFFSLVSTTFAGDVWISFHRLTEASLLLNFLFSKITILLNFCGRTSRSEFVVSVNRYLEARSHKLSVGMRFKMRFEGEEVPERRYHAQLAYDLSKLGTLKHLPMVVLHTNADSAEQSLVLEKAHHLDGPILNGDR